MLDALTHLFGACWCSHAHPQLLAAGPALLLPFTVAVTYAKAKLGRRKALRASDRV